ncbi:MAG: plasma-membrane proton-efflux P-type ATPase [Dehalococcoidales bacterium]
MAKKKKIQEQPRAKIAKVPASELNPRKMKKPVVGENPGQPQIKDNLTGSSAAKLKDLPPTEIAKVSTGASNKSPGVTPLVEAKTEAESKTPSDLTPQLVKRVHELYEELGREEVRAVQDWDNNQRKVQKPEAESEAKHGVQIEPEPEAKIEPATDSKAKPQAGINVESKTDSKQETRDQPKQDVKTETKPDIKTGKPKDKKKGQSQGKGNTPQADGQKLKDLPLADVQKQLSGSVDGLSKAEAQTRLEKYGYNELTEKKNSAILLFLSYFWGPIPIMIIIAAVLSAVLRHWPDLAVIVALLLLNAIVGFREVHQAGNVIAALKKKLAVLAKVKRDGAWVSIPSRELVPGDVVRVRIGDIVPADARLFDGEPVEVDQSALTGESLPVEHKPGDAVYSGSIIKRGEIDALVYATGSGTFYGKTAELVKATETHSHLQRAVTKIANFLIYIALALGILILTVSLLRHDPLLDVVRFVLVLTIAAVPVAMPAVISVTMALGARALALKQAIVTKLTSIEELAGVDVLCSDKTGTLTQNKLMMGTPFTIDKITPEQIILDAALASRAEDKDTIDLAVLAGIKDTEKLKTYQVTHFQPFDPVHKRTEATIKTQGQAEFKVTKGAPQVILALDTNSASIKSRVDQAVNGFAARGFRSLGVAHTDSQGQWQFVGIIPLSDPLREDSKATIETAEKMGLRVKMVTGDQLAIAKEIGRQLDLGTDIIDASLFNDDKNQKTAQLDDIIERADGFAQVFPEHKYHIVEVLQKHGHIVGMTGDGVNDAPALKKADAGIAVDGATDAARAAADIVLLLPGLSVIIDAIKESRKIFRRMTNYAIYRIAETIRVLLFLTLAILIFNFYPVTAIMIVLLAIMNDGAMLAIAYDNVLYSNQPETWNMRQVLGISSILGIFGVLSSFGLFYVGLDVLHLSKDVVMTLMYLKFSIAGHLTVFVARTREPFWSEKPARILLLAVGGTQVLATFIAVYGLLMTPLGWALAGLVWGYALVMFIVQDRVKLLAYKIFPMAKTTPPAAPAVLTKNAPKSPKASAI